MTDVSVFADLGQSEVELDQPGEYYWRQCHPGFLDGGVPSVQMFSESTGDGGKLSGARSSKATAELAYEERVRSGAESAGTWGVTVGEIGTAGTRAVDDSSIDCSLPTGHTYVDYRHLASHPTRRAVRSRLHEFAVAHGRHWPRDT